MEAGELKQFTLRPGEGAASLLWIQLPALVQSHARGGAAHVPCGGGGGGWGGGGPLARLLSKEESNRAQI